MPVRDVADQPLAARCPAGQPGELGRGTRLVEEDEAVGIEMALPDRPAAAVANDVRPPLFGGAQDFF